jgi:HYR domain/Right handed beta helix region
MKKLSTSVAAFAVAAAGLAIPTTINTPIASADAVGSDFESFTLGSVDGQDGWEIDGAYDAEIVDASATHASFGSRSLRISNAVTSTSFGDHLFSKPLTEEAGETDAVNGGESTGPRQKYFDAEWSFASAVPGAEQPGLQVVVSPDRGDGARMGYIQMADTPAGIDINYYGYDEAVGDPCGNNFVLTQVATGLERAVPHTIRVLIAFNDGRNNDVVELYVDGVLSHTGKTWEDYFRDNCEATPQASRTVDSLLFRAGGTDAPATSGFGFLIDDVSLESSSPPPCTTDCYVDAATGSDVNGGTGPADALRTIQTAIDRVDPNGTVFVAAGAYPVPAGLDVDKPLTLDGAGSDVVTIDASAHASYSVAVTADDVTLEGFTLTGNPAGTYGLKISSSSPTRLSNITVDDVVVNNSKRTGIDLNGVDGGLITNVEVHDVPSGNGLSATDSNNIVFENVTTSNNAWGGLAVYTYGRYYSLGSANVTIQGNNSFGEANPVYVETGNYNDPGNPAPVTNLTVNGFDYTVANDDHRAGGELFTFYQNTRSEAIEFALALTNPESSYVNEVATGDFWVGTLGGVDMTIQAAVDHAEPGDTINVLPGTYEGNVVVDEFVKIIGSGSGSGDATNTVLQKDANSAVVTLTASGASAADPLLLQDLRIEPNDVYGINVPGTLGTVEFLELDNVRVVGTNGIGGETGFKVSTAGSLADVVVTDSAFDNLQYGWYITKHGDWGPGGTNVTDVQVSNTSFSNNEAKGIYVEKLSNATFDNVTVANNGLNAVAYNNNAGFDINLKGDEGYENIAITNSTFSRNGLGVEKGIAIAINARDDGSYAGVRAATLTGVTVTGNDITDNERGIRFGEPGAGNATPTDVVVAGNNITGNIEGGVINETLSQTNAIENWWGDASGPSGEGPGTGDSVSLDVAVCPWLDGPTGTGNLVLDDCPGANELDVVNTVDWNGVTPDAAQTFEICIEGPSHVVADCQLAGSSTETLTWSDLYHGDYTVTQTDPGAEWTVDITGSPVTVVDGVPSTPANVTNTHDPAEGDGPTPDAPPTFPATPDDISVVTEPGASSATVEYPLPEAADDDTETLPTVVCTPASGTEFPVGDNTVTCTATDSADQIAETTFTISVSPYSDLIAVDPARFLDTRGTGSNVTIDGIAQGEGPVPAGTSITIPVAERGDVTADAIGAMVNIAAINPSGNGYVTLYPCTDEVPTAASLNFEAGVSISNATFVELSDDGDVCAFASNTTGLALDVVGYMPVTSRIDFVAPARLLETRIGEGLTTIDGRSQGDGAITAGNTIEVQVAGRAGVADDAVAAMVNVAAVNPTDTGFITLFPCDSEQPVAASLNYTAGTNISNTTLVALSSDGVLCVFSEDATDLTIDVIGYASPGTDVGTLNPSRLLETRTGTGQVTVDGIAQGDGQVDAGDFISVPIAGRSDVPDDAIAVVVNLAAINPAAVGYATLYPCSETPPVAASLNYRAGVNISNATLVDLSDDGDVCLFTSATAHYTIDVLSFVTATSVDA